MRQVLRSAVVAFLAAVVVALVYVFADSVIRGPPLAGNIVSPSLFLLRWCALAALYAMALGLLLARVGLLRWWSVLIGCLLPVLVAGVVTWPPPHLIAACIPEREWDCHRTFEMLWGQQREAWPIYLYPLLKYLVTFVPASAAYYFVARPAAGGRIP
jgi:hypothetical protein